MDSYEEQHFIEENRKGWNLRTREHLKSEFYNVQKFRSEKQLSLKSPELQLLGDLEKKKVLHLQCHFGLDTLSLAYLGAIVTGVDFSTASIDAARDLAKETGIDAVFVCSDVQQFDSFADGSYDIVFTSYGVLPWIGNLNKWAKGIVQSLKVGGKFVMVEFHPVLDLLNDGQISGSANYFNNEEPNGKLVHGTYTNPSAPLEYYRYLWQHSPSEVINTLVNSGLCLEHFMEYPFCSYPLFSELKTERAGLWYPSEGTMSIPYMYSVMAKKNAADEVDL